MKDALKAAMLVSKAGNAFFQARFSGGAAACPHGLASAWGSKPARAWLTGQCSPPARPTPLHRLSTAGDGDLGGVQDGQGSRGHVHLRLCGPGAAAGLPARALHALLHRRRAGAAGRGQGAMAGWDTCRAVQGRGVPAAAADWLAWTRTRACGQGSALCRAARRFAPTSHAPPPRAAPQPMALSDGVVAKSGAPASILPAGHELGAEPVPLFRKITEEEVAQHRTR